MTSRLFFWKINKSQPTNQAFSDWDSIFGDNMMTMAALDRLLHHADIYQIEGESYRKKQAMKSNQETG